MSEDSQLAAIVEPDRAAAALDRVSLAGLLLSFLKIGSIGFGGGMAIIALMEQEFVVRRRLIAADEFVNGVGLSQLLGAFAVNTAVFIGYRLFGLFGAMLSAVAFLAPSVTIVVLISHIYFRYHTIPALKGAVAGLSPVVIALILSATWSIGRKVLRSWPTVLIGIGSLLAGISGVSPVWILLGAGLVSFLLRLEVFGARVPLAPRKSKTGGATKLLSLAFPFTAPTKLITGTFLKIGLVFLGGGFVLIPILHDRLVVQLGWLNAQEFIDGLAISNLTPGPVALLATFAGYHLDGPLGALTATVMIFTPGVVLMLVISHEYLRFQNDRHVQQFLAGVNPAVAGLVLSAALALGRTATSSWQAYILFGLSFALLVGMKWHPVFVLAIGATAGYFGLLP